ncbi:MAG: alcohol dehydrogenase [Rhodospirillaceae bacterium]|nr:MAG: alcohol dehydrogenase [Rhodospirillaceae bacterium]
MKAAVFHEAGKPLVIETLDDPKPRPTDVIIKVHRCGICGTDLHMTSGDAWAYPPDSIPGHEFAGEIVEVGSQVEGFKKGDNITAVPTAGCGHCDGCTHHVWPLCDNLEPIMGGFGEYMRIPSRAALKLPSSFTFGDIALVEPYAVGLYGVRVAAIQPGDRVLILGAGTVALTTAFWAKRLGAGRVVIASRSARREPMALEMGADAFVQTGDDEVQKVVEALGGAPQIVFECAGAPGLLAQAVQHVRKFGQVVSMGFCTSPDSVIPALVSMKAARLSFPVGYGLRDFEYVADTMLAGDIDPKTIITSVISLGELPIVFEDLRGPNTQTKVQVSFAGM